MHADFFCLLLLLRHKFLLLVHFGAPIKQIRELVTPVALPFLTLLKGEMLDAVTRTERQTLVRECGCVAHLPYLQKLKRPEPTNRSNLHTQAVWRFEPLDVLSATTVGFDTPMRIRHVASNKYLCVDSSRPAVRTEEARASSGLPGGLGMLGGVMGLGGGKEAKEARRRRGRGAKEPEEAEGGRAVNAEAAPDGMIQHFFDCSLVDAIGTNPSSTLFQIRSMGIENGALLNSASVCRLEHKIGGRWYFMTEVVDYKPRFPADIERRFKSKSRVGFALSSTGAEVIKIMPISLAEDATIANMLGYVPTLQLYTARYLMAKTDDELPVDMCKPLVRLLVALVEDLSIKGTARDTSDFSDSELSREALDLNITDLSALYNSGEINSPAQSIAVDVKLLNVLFDAALAPYNRCYFAREGDGPFGRKPASGLPKAVQRLIFVCLQVFFNLSLFLFRRATRIFESGSLCCFTNHTH